MAEASLTVDGVGLGTGRSRPGLAEADLKLFDDGWRLSNFLVDKRGRFGSVQKRDLFRMILFVTQLTSAGRFTRSGDRL